MNKRFLPKVKVFTLTILCACGFSVSLFAQEPVNVITKDSPVVLQEQARKYRQAGLESQRIGDLPAAMSLYQKAIALDPTFAVAYNDLGVIYEAAGLPERAEESYLKAIMIDANYSSAYSNLAIFYETKRDLKKAAFFWEKRAALGSLEDPWTLKAMSRLKDLRLSLSKQTIADQQEAEVLGLIQDAQVYQAALNNNDKVLAQDRFLKAKQNYQKGNLATAFKYALDAQYLDQDNPEIEAFIEKTVSRTLSH